MVSKLKRPNGIFFLDKIKYLGHMIASKQILNELKITAPDKNTPLQSFFLLSHYYQVFIQNLHDLRATLLNELLKKDKPQDWIAECQEVFEK